MAVIIILSSLSTFILILLVYKLVTKKEQVVSGRIDKYVQPAAPKVSTGLAESSTKHWLLIVRFLSQFASASPTALYFNNKLMQAGIPLRGAEFFVIAILLSVSLGFVGIIITKGGILIGLVMGIMTYLSAHVYINIKITQRIKAFNHQLGETLALMANALRSGHSFLQTVDMVSREMTPPISQEFTRLLREMNLGAPTETALNNLLNRVRSEDLDLAVTAIIIQRQIGGNLAEIMDNIATTIRDRHMMKREVQTLTAQGRISGWIIGLLPFFILTAIWFLNPGYIRMLFTDPIGHIMIGYALTSQVVGMIIVRKIVNIEM